MRKFAAGFFFLSMGTLAVGGPQGRKPLAPVGVQQRTPSVTYLLHWEYGFGLKDSESTVTSIDILRRCIGNRCMPYPEAGHQSVCPPKRLCEIVVIKEQRTQGGGFQYQITNSLSNGQRHFTLIYDEIRLKAISVNDTKDPLQARKEAIDMVRELVLCHDQLAHQPPEGVESIALVSPDPGHDCQCDIRP